MDIITSLLIGAIGGNIGGAMLKKVCLGRIGNSLAGMIGGGMFNQILQSATAENAQNTLLLSIIGGAIGGVIVMALFGIIKRSWVEINT